MPARPAGSHRDYDGGRGGRRRGNRPAAQREAKREIRALDRPPHLSALRPEFGTEQLDVQTRRMADGVRYRVVYQRSVSDHAPLAALTRENVAKGEQVRELRQLPMKLTLMDDECALIALEPCGSALDPSALVVHPSALLEAFGEIFETYWRAATPLGEGRGGLSARQTDVLALLAQGATDATIARQLHLSARTVGRTVGELIEPLDARTRFQAGLNAVSRGYIPHDEGR